MSGNENLDPIKHYVCFMHMSKNKNNNKKKHLYLYFHVEISKSVIFMVFSKEWAHSAYNKKE